MAFDTDKLIREIERRKAIWDVTSEEYSDRDLKKRQWEEITIIMSEDNLTEDEINEFGKSLQQKWRNIRTSFNREIKRRAGATSGSAASRKSPYVYFEQLQFLINVVNNDTQNNMDEICTVEINADSGSIEGEPPVSKKKKTSVDDLVQVLRKNIVKREERERMRESDSDRLFLLSLLEDFKSIPKHRKLSTRIELIDVIKRAQMPSMETHHSEFGGSYVEYEPGTSSTGSNRPEISVSGQYRHGNSSGHRPETSSNSTKTNYRSEASSTENRRHAYSTSLEDNTVYTEVLTPSDINVRDTSQGSE